jgi:hypothetical protein
MKNHNWDHGKGDICKTCGKIHIKRASEENKLKAYIDLIEEIMYAQKT